MLFALASLKAHNLRSQDSTGLRLIVTRRYPAHIFVRRFKNASAFLPHRAGCEAPSSLRGCDLPCLNMRNNAPVEHCVAEAFILHREIVLTMKPGFTLRAYLTIKITSIAR